MKLNIPKKILPILAVILTLLLCMALSAIAAGNHAPESLALAAAAVPAGVIVKNFNIDNLKIPMAEFEKLKAKYKHLYILDVVVDDDEKYQFVACRPSRSLLSAVLASGDDTEKINDLIIKNMVVGGDLDAIDDGLVYGALIRELGKILKLGKGFFAKA